MNTINYELEHRIFSNEKSVYKLKTVLSTIILPTFKSSDDTVLEKLFDNLCYSSEEGYIDEQRLIEMLLPWLLDVVNCWTSINEEVKGFILRVIGYLVKEPAGFTLLKENNIFSFLSQIREKLKEQSNCIILAYVNVVYNLLNHDLGRQWIIDGELWKEIIDCYFNSPSIYVRRRSNQLLSNFLALLWQNSALTHSIFAHILRYKGKQSPILNAFEIKNPSVKRDSKAVCNVEYKEFRLNLYKLISDILLFVKKKLGVSSTINKFFGQYQILELAWTDIHNENDMDILLTASKLLCLWNILTINFSQCCTNKQSEAALSLVVTKHFNLLIIRHLFPKIILETCVEYTSLWHKFYENFDREENMNDITKLENLIFIVQALPMFICIRHTRLEKNEITELFVDKLFKVVSPDLVRLCYVYRDNLRTSKLSLEKITSQVIYSFIRISSSCEKEQAVMIFQGFLHLLKDFVQTDTCGDSSRNIGISGDNLIRTYPELLSALLSGLICYLTKFKFSWRDSLEIVCLMSFVQSVITNQDVPFLVCAEALKLTKIVLLHFIPPNLALLVDTLQGSSMRDLGDQLFKLLGSIHWEVRDSTLEVLEVISCLAEDKFPAFQELLIEHDLPDIILSIVKCDPESYVRASALSCLSELVKVNVIWESYLQKEQVLNLFLSLLYFETEGIVRNKATILIKDIVKFRTIPKANLESVYDTLYHVAQNDLHWEVKVSALNFWDTVREKSFVAVGMVDGSFPEVIFSKEKKKIIQMTPNEMNLQIVHALIDLSSNGCLQTLWDTLQDEYDIEVQRKSAFIIKTLADTVYCYDILTKLKHITLPNSQQFGNSPGIDCLLEEEQQLSRKESPNEEDRRSHDAVIDEIVGENDIKLLSGLITLTDPVRTWPKIKRITLSPLEFLLKIKSIDLSIYMRESSQSSKHSWDMESLLDDIILYSKGNKEEGTDQNCVDCY